MKRQINLYGAEFRPRRQWASLNQMALVWGGSVLLLLCTAGVIAWQQHVVGRELVQVRAALEIKRGEAQRLDADLSRIRDPQLSLQRIEIADGYVNLSGFAGRSQDVPAWVNRFKQTPSLAGKQFGELTLSRDKEGRLAFQLSGIEREKP